MPHGGHPDDRAFDPDGRRVDCIAGLARAGAAAVRHRLGAAVHRPRLRRQTTGILQGLAFPVRRLSLVADEDQWPGLTDAVPELRRGPAVRGTAGVLRTR